MEPSAATEPARPDPPSPASRAAMRDWRKAYEAYPKLAATFVWSHVTKLLTTYPGERVYEVGFGSGSNLAWAESVGWEVAGCEVAFPPFSIAKSHLPDADLRRESILECSAPSSYYDVVIDRAALAYLEPNDLQQAFGHIHRILRPGGVFMFTPYGDRHTRPFPEPLPIPHYWSLDEACRMFVETKWQILEADQHCVHLQGDAPEHHEHTLRIVVRKLAG